MRKFAGRVQFSGMVCLGFHCDGISEARLQGFSPDTPVSSPPSSVNGSASKIKLK